MDVRLMDSVGGAEATPLWAVSDRTSELITYITCVCEYCDSGFNDIPCH